MTNPNIIIIVGAGLSGQTLALGLAKIGFQIYLVERRSNFKKRRGGAYLMQPNALRALYEVVPEVQEELDNLGVDVPSSGGKLFAWWMIRDALTQQILNNTSDQPHDSTKDKTRLIKLYLGYRFVSLEDDPNKPYIRAKFKKDDELNDTAGMPVDDGSKQQDTTATTLELEGALLLSADGVNSSVRNFLGLPPAEPTGSGVWRGSLEITDDTTTSNRRLRELLDKGVHPLGYISLGGVTTVTLLNFHSKYPQVMTWSVSTKDVSFTHPSQAVEPYHSTKINVSNGKDLDVRSITDAIFELADPDDMERQILQKTTPLPEQNGMGWGGRGRVTLVGDAARAIRSAGGQAGGMAFEDVCILTRVLREAATTTNKPNNNDDSPHGPLSLLGDYESTQELLRQFENFRLPRARTVAKDAYDRAERIYKGIKPNEEEEKADRERLEWIYKGV